MKGNNNANANMQNAVFCCCSRLCSHSLLPNWCLHFIDLPPSNLLRTQKLTHFAIFTQRQFDRNVELPEYECCTVLKVLDTVDNSILSMQSTCMLYTMYDSWVFLLFIQCIYLVRIECQCANSAFCIVKLQLAPCFICLPPRKLGKSSEPMQCQQQQQ